MEIVGLMPAAGQATRLGVIPCSKELIPIGFTRNRSGDPRLTPVSQYLLEKYRKAGASKVYIILREGKWDIPSYYGDGAALGLNLAYLMLQHTYGIPYTVDQAYPFVRGAMVLLGFPDILFEPEDVYQHLIESLSHSDTDLTLGLFRVENLYEASKSDMVSWDPSDGRIIDIAIKPEETDRTHSWICAAWKPSFTEFLHQFLQADLIKREQDLGVSEIHVSEMVLAATQAGLTVRGLAFDDTFLDVGTPRSLQKGWRRMGI